MIQANELRRNNLIFYGNMIYPVDRITEQSISVRIGNQSLRTAKPHEFEPIPLTPELLEACGFDAVRPRMMPGYEFYRSKSWDGRHRFRWDNVEGFAMETVGSGWVWHFKEIQYLHQVQNFFFALTGTELSINLEKVKA